VPAESGDLDSAPGPNRNCQPLGCRSSSPAPRRATHAPGAARTSAERPQRGHHQRQLLQLQRPRRARRRRGPATTESSAGSSGMVSTSSRRWACCHDASVSITGFDSSPIDLDVQPLDRHDRPASARASRPHSPIGPTSRSRSSPDRDVVAAGRELQHLHGAHAGDPRTRSTPPSAGIDVCPREKPRLNVAQPGGSPLRAAWIHSTRCVANSWFASCASRRIRRTHE